MLDQTGEKRQHVDEDGWWTVHRGDIPIVGTAIHDGHGLRADLRSLVALSDDQRLREEDPYTAYIIQDLANRIIVHRSRFEVDLNRARDGAVYVDPSQAWGLSVWRDALPRGLHERSLVLHDEYYRMLRSMLLSIERRHGGFIVLDVHSYNHRRDGPDATPSDPAGAPEINIGTHSMDRSRWADVLETLLNALRRFEFRGRRFDVRENVAFQGRGEQTRFIHEHFPQTGCAIAIEFKKFFMDEWTGEPDFEVLEALRALTASTVPGLVKALDARQ
ncbi:N-formylglutamate amidohydrolase [Ensifer adhaerens]|uniref:N-formylglutamate amidohydrolase n=1 Tax=Ensifer adhaerens TaxID=106592 RepID=A0A0L8C2E5_ENSAD|nr:N-formylglutamate amidohydrolase [Ensifer adhaerens]KOF20978.1 N-formylglutamate amidohydrolase [Ensifer adhaerens]